MDPKLLLIVTAKDGLYVLDTPRPRGAGAKPRRPAVPVGTQLYAYSIHFIGGVPYALLQPLDPQKPEWVRVAEADGITKYVDIIELGGKDSASALAGAITLLANAVTLLATNLREWVKK